MNTNCPFCLENHLLTSPLLADMPGAFATAARGFDGCYLIIPKQHTETLQDLPDTWWADFKAALAVLPIKDSSYNLSLNYGKPAGQTVNHIHFWIVPRADGEPASGEGLATLIAQANQQ